MKKATYVIIFKKGSRMLTKYCSGQFWKYFTNFWIASFLSSACSTFLSSLSCARQTEIESSAVPAQASSSNKLRYTSRPPWARNCSLEFLEACAMSHRRGSAYCFNGESDMMKFIKWGMMPFSAACSCRLLLILHRLNSAFRTWNAIKRKEKIYHKVEKSSQLLYSETRTSSNILVWKFHNFPIQDWFYKLTIISSPSPV